MKKQVITFFALVLTLSLCVVSCKKKDNNNSAGGSSSTAGSTNGSTTNTPVDAHGYPTGSYNGILVSFKADAYTSAFAEFFNSALTYSQMPAANGISVNSVKVNSTLLVYDTGSGEYGDNTFTLTFPPAKWEVNGAGAIPTFIYINSDAIPTYTATASLPDTIYLNQSLTISLSGASGFSQAEVDINDNHGHNLSQVVAAGATSVTFPKDSINKLTLSSMAYIDMDFYKYNTQTFLGKAFLFISDLESEKLNVIIKQ